MSGRRHSFLDQCINQIEAGLETVFATRASHRPSPAASAADDQATHPDDSLSETDKQQSARLMRVNHTGEVCAQALYRGQLACARQQATREMLQQACDEETDHLAWCRDRIETLGSHTSYLDPLFYFNAYVIGWVAASAGDRWSLGFVEETERQVGAHLAGHLDRLSESDVCSRAVVAQMQQDEQQHADHAREKGAAALPGWARQLMRLHAKVMTVTTYYI